MYESLCEILRNYVEEPEGGLSPDTSFTEDLHMTSLDVMTMIGEVEDRFHITIATEELNGIYTLRELTEYLEGKI